jgi:hypothetical protein
VLDLAKVSVALGTAGVALDVGDPPVDDGADGRGGGAGALKLLCPTKPFASTSNLPRKTIADATAPARRSAPSRARFFARPCRGPTSKETLKAWDATMDPSASPVCCEWA